MSSDQFHEHFRQVIHSIVGYEHFEIFSRKSNPDILVITVPSLGLLVDIEDPYRPYEHKVPSPAVLNGYIEKVESTLRHAASSRVEIDFDSILGAFKFYISNCDHSVDVPLDVAGKKANEDVLFQVCCNTFAHRIGTTCEAALQILQQNKENLHRFELPIGILLRSAVLDSILMLAWAHEKKFASAIASESFKRIDTISTSTDDEHKLIERWKRYSEYFNVHNLSKKQLTTRIDQAFEHLPNSPNIEEYKVVYSYYSKFDHFSLIPFILRKSVFQRLGVMLMATHLIKHAFCAMTSIYFPEQAIEFQNILGVKMVENDDGTLSFKNHATG